MVAMQSYIIQPVTERQACWLLPYCREKDYAINSLAPIGEDHDLEGGHVTGPPILLSLRVCPKSEKET